MNQDLARAILERAGHTVDVVGDGSAALAAVQAKTYDLVLMDIQMPGMDGISATQRIRALPGTAAQVPIVAMTANVLTEQVAEIRAAGWTITWASRFGKTRFCRRSIAGPRMRQNPR